ncbi:MAG: type VI secretion system baseplate subunit TssK [Isosphaeraceae bacterium]|nr:type VI secretion system baseplate subunit TssK [Isosphaeraceae bacterium]
MANRPVHWQEGMFLRPHHFQASARHFASLTNLGQKWDSHYNWGLRSIELNEGALGNSRFVVNRLEARLRDGTLVSIPQDGVLNEIDLKNAFDRNTTLTVYLGVPAFNPNGANLASEGKDLARYRVETQPLEDENSGQNPQPITTRVLNFKLLLSNQELAGYEVVPIARIQRSERAEATPELDQTYFPPVLSCSAWAPLRQGLLRALHDRIGKKIEAIAGQVVSRGIGFDSHSQGDPLIFAQLRELNEAYALLGVYVFAEGVHPLPMYAELCRMVGQLAIFGETRRTPELPDYDHDDLGTCFYSVYRIIQDLIEKLIEPEYKEAHFVGAGLRMEVSIKREWLDPTWQMFIGVKTQLEAEDCVKLLTRGQLDMKVGSSEKVDNIFRLGAPGLIFNHTPNPPRALPKQMGLVYFQISRESQTEEWNNVQRSLTLAVRLNENLIAGNIQGQQVLTIRTSGGQTTPLQLTLYVTPKSS